jgi:BirA family biotin operon repressor/biotin-[acetyl-CoA-carboxylase] ligase
MRKLYEILHHMGDGKFRSGQELGVRMGMSRGGVWKQIRMLEKLGVEVYCVPGEGYRLGQPLELLSRSRVRAHIGDVALPLLADLEIYLEIDSTNAQLMRRADAGARSGEGCLAERQLAGRGRRGRTWLSPFGRNLYLSLLWRFDCGPDRLPGLSLAVGVAVSRALEASGVYGCGLKWPNDLVLEGRKFGGVLIEIAGEVAGECCAVIGVGVNLQMPRGLGTDIDQPWTDLQSSAGSPLPSRNLLAGRVLDQLLALCDGFPHCGFAPYRDAWVERDIHFGRPVIVHSPRGQWSGVARGVDRTGALLLDRNGAIVTISSGEVSMRPVTDVAAPLRRAPSSTRQARDDR